MTSPSSDPGGVISLHVRRLLHDARLIFGPVRPYTHEELDAGHERLMQRAEARECARCRRRGTRKATAVTDEGGWPVCKDKDDCRKHQPKRVRHLEIVEPKPPCTCLDPDCRG